jgi:hypothetical protein
MKLNKQMLLGIAGALLLSGSAGLAQESKAPKAAEGKQMTLTGCLNKGADIPQHFIFVDQKSGKKWTVTGPANLEKHAANHTVRITGAPTAKVFNVTKVEHVSETCEAKTGSADRQDKEK